MVRGRLRYFRPVLNMTPMHIKIAYCSISIHRMYTAAKASNPSNIAYKCNDKKKSYKKFLDPDNDDHQNLAIFSLCHCQYFMKISSKSIHILQINRQMDTIKTFTFSAEVMIIKNWSSRVLLLINC